MRVDIISAGGDLRTVEFVLCPSDCAEKVMGDILPTTFCIMKVFFYIYEMAISIRFRVNASRMIFLHIV